MNKIVLLTQFSIESIRDALYKLNRYENLKINGLTAYQLNQIESVDPVLFSEIAEKIKCGRWYPFTGLWCNFKKHMSQEELTRSEIYSSFYFSTKFGYKSRTFFADTVSNNMLPQTAYNAGYDICVINDSECERWLDSCEETRVYACPMPEYDDISDIDENYLTDNCILSVEEFILEKFSLPMNIITQVLPKESNIINETEKALSEYEIFSTLNNKDTNSETEELWKKYFEGNAITLPAYSINEDAHINILNDNISIDSFKFTSDGSKEYVIRLRENLGKDGQIYVVCDKLDFGFKCEMTPFKTSTFRIDKDGFVTETFITE